MTEIRGMPSLWAQAAGLAAKGRNGDEMLVHMTPKEVATLSSLMPGGRPTTNPHTGLPEFFGLSDFFSGIGDYFSSSEIPTEAPSQSSYFGADGWDYGVAEGAGIDATTGADGGGWNPSSEVYATASGGGVADERANALAVASDPPGSGSSTPLDKFAGARIDLNTSLSRGGSNSGIFSQVSDFVKNNRELSTIALIAGLAGLQAYERQQAQNANRAAQRRSIFRGGEYQATPGQEFDARPTRRDFTRPAAGYNPITSGPTNFYQRGAMPQRYAEGGPVGIEALTTGAIRGPGAGMEDKIHGTIDGRREVRLSDGEHVIPADVVSQLGDGSSEAGHKRLSQMIHAVRAEKTGSTRQPPPIDPKRVMPR